MTLVAGVVLWPGCGSGSGEGGGSVLSSLGGDIELAAGNDPARAARLKAILDGSVVERPAGLERVRAPADSLSLRPAGEAVAETEPALTWDATGAAIYGVTVVNEIGAIELESPPLAQTRWKVSKALRRGRLYSWHLTADGAKAGDASFRVLPESDYRFWSIASRFYADQPLLLGAIAQDLGLLSEAQRLYEEADGGAVLLRNLSAIRRAKN